jgi:hypothetical protein
VPMPMAVRSKASVCSRCTPRTAGSNPAEGMGVLLLCLMCVLRVAATATG